MVSIVSPVHEKTLALGVVTAGRSKDSASGGASDLGF